VVRQRLRRLFPFPFHSTPLFERRELTRELSRYGTHRIPHVTRHLARIGTRGGGAVRAGRACAGRCARGPQAQARTPPRIHPKSAQQRKHKARNTKQHTIAVHDAHAHCSVCSALFQFLTHSLRPPFPHFPSIPHGRSSRRQHGQAPHHGQWKSAEMGCDGVRGACARRGAIVYVRRTHFPAALSLSLFVCGVSVPLGADLGCRQLGGQGVHPDDLPQLHARVAVAQEGAPEGR
jgi:hypothetical protein